MFLAMIQKVVEAAIQLLESLITHSPYDFAEDCIVRDLQLSIEKLFTSSSETLAVLSWKSAMQLGIELRRSFRTSEAQTQIIKDHLSFGLRQSSCSFRRLAVMFLPASINYGAANLNLRQTIALYRQDTSPYVRAGLAQCLPELAKVDLPQAISNQKDGSAHELFLITLTQMLLSETSDEVIEASLTALPLLASSVEKQDIFGASESDIFERLVGFLSS